MKSNYLIAGILISVEAPLSLNDTFAFSLYRVGEYANSTSPLHAENIEEKSIIFNDKTDSADCVYKICLLEDEDHPLLKGSLLFQDEMNLYLDDYGETLHFFKIPLTGKLAAWCETKGARSLTIHFRPTAAPYFRNSLGCFNAASFEYILFSFGKYLFHCSYIDVDGEAVLFSAHSGGGKTTHGLLWEQTGFGEMINGDRAVIEEQQRPNACGDADSTQDPAAPPSPEKAKTHLRKQEYMVHGLPIAGSSGVFKNRSLPLKAIFMLEKAPVNEVIDLPPSKQFLKVFEQLTVHTWDREFVTAATDFTAELIRHVPVKLLRCRPDSEAVDKVRGALAENDTLPAERQ